MGAEYNQRRLSVPALGARVQPREVRETSMLNGHCAAIVTEDARPPRLSRPHLSWLPRLIKARSSTSRFARDLYGALPVKRLFLGCAASSLFGAGKAVLRPVACDQVPGERGGGQGTETLAKLWRLAA